VRCACSLPAIFGFWPRIARGAALGAATIMQSVGLLVYFFSSLRSGLIVFYRWLSFFQFILIVSITIYYFVNAE
jgi:hypothetical protein